MSLLKTLVFIGILLVVAYLYIKRTFSYWKRKGVPYIEPSIIYGNTKGIFSERHIRDVLKGPYEKLKGHGPIGGLYFFHTPIAVLLDLKVIKQILIKDFPNFMDRAIFYNKKDDPISANLFALDSTEWKQMRNRMTPTFTSGKIKYMFPTVVKVGSELKEAIDNELKITDVIEVKDLSARYTTDVIGTCGFGVESYSLKDPNALFRSMGRKVFIPGKYKALKLFISNTSKKFAKFLRLTIWPDDVRKFFLNAIADTVNYREKNNIRRNDFLDIMIQLKDSNESESESSANKISLNELTAQAFIFFAAGFDGSASLMTFTLYELALNPDIQIKARKEINEVIQKHNGEFTYEAMMDMPYLEQVINESLRKYPAAPHLFRRTIKEYHVPNTDIVLDPETLIWIPIDAIQNDPEYYPDPSKFNPDRFTPDAVSARDPMTFLPFGGGPRNCVAIRFARMQSRIGIVQVLHNFTVSICSETPKNIIIDPKGSAQSPLGGMFLKFQKV